MPRELPTASLSLHPDAGLVPEMPPDQYERFLKDVKARGVLQPLELIPGTKTVIEGRTRLKAATEAGFPSVPVVDADLRGDSPVLYMLRAAALRRQLTRGQAAALAVEIEERFKAEAKERQRQGGRKGGRGRAVIEHTGAIVPSVTPAVNVTLATATRYVALTEMETPLDVRRKAGDALVDWEHAKLPPELPPAKSRDRAAVIAGTNPRYVSDAKRIKRDSPETYEKVKAGKLTLTEAKRVIAPAKAKPASKADDVRATSRNDSQDLEPCPFCGAKRAQTVFGFGGGNKTPMEYVQCEGCLACGPRKAGSVSSRVAWNQRATK